MRKSFKKSMILFCLIAAFIPTAMAASEDAKSLFSEANAKYQNGDFNAAAELYGKLAQTRPSAAVYYNAGNASLKAGHKGKALLYYERALRLSPRDEDLLWNTRILKDSLRDRLSEDDRNLMLFWIRRVTKTLTLNETGLFLTGALLILMLSAFVKFLAPPQKKISRFLFLLGFLSLILSSGLYGFKWNEVKNPTAVIMDKEIYAHYGPSLRETKAFLLHEGAEAKILDRSRDWAYIVLADGNSGWIPQASCEAV
jgi:tetratricopeptide (TPR) repeat protein